MKTILLLPLPKVKPDLDTQLYVEQDGFYTVPELGKRESILISQELRRNSELNEYTMQQPCLFNSTQQHINNGQAEY